MTPIEQPTQIVALLVLGCIVMLPALVFVFKPRVPAAIFAYAGMWLCKWGGYCQGLEYSQLLLWGITTAIAVGLFYMLPRSISTSSYGMGYIGSGALAGTLVGMISPSVTTIVIGSVAGAFFGALAFSRTHAGQQMPFPSSKFLNYLCAKGLPSVVALSIIAITMAYIIL